MSIDDELSRREFLAVTAAASALAAIGRLPVPGATSSIAPELHELSATAAVRAMRRGELTAERYAEALLARCARYADLNAFITLRPDHVREQARAADRLRAANRPLGLLHGLPIPLKDSVNTKDLPTSGGTKALLGFEPKADAPLVARLRAQGALVLGKTNLHELSAGYTSANQTTGAVHNPYDRTRIPGGSSGGSAAAVAARLAPLSVAEDTGGSVRVPAALCGIAGLRPTTGRYDTSGVVPMTALFDQLGPHARTVEDLVLFDQAITGDVSPVTARSLRGATFGVVREFFYADLEPEVSRVTDAALDKLRQAGARVVEVSLPELGTLVQATAFPIILHDLGPALTAYLAKFSGPSLGRVIEQLSPDIKATFERAPIAGDEKAYANAVNIARPQLQQQLADAFRTHSLTALVSPACATSAIPINTGATMTVGGASVPTTNYLGRNAIVGSTAGLPGLVLPAGLTRDGLPVGLEFAGPAKSDRTLLAFGLALEAVLGAIPAPR